MKNLLTTAAFSALLLSLAAQTLSYKQAPPPASSFYDTVFVASEIYEQTIRLDELDFLDAQPGALVPVEEPSAGIYALTVLR